MQNEPIEGEWDDLVGRLDLGGQRVRIIVLNAATEGNAAGSQEDEWLKRFNAWAKSQKPVNHFIDDSRESIYSGTVDDPR